MPEIFHDILHPRHPLKRSAVSSVESVSRWHLPKWKMPSRVSRTRLVLFPLVLFIIATLSFSSYSRGVGANVGMRIIPAEQCGEEVFVALPGSEQRFVPKLPASEKKSEGPGKETTEVAPPAQPSQDASTGEAGGTTSPDGTIEVGPPSGGPTSTESPTEGGPTSTPIEFFANDWFGADRASGKPDVAPDGDVDAFTIANSALWNANGPASFVCNTFSVPQGRHVTPALGLSFAIRSTEPLPPLQLPSQNPTEDFEVLPSEPVEQPADETLEVGPPEGGTTSPDETIEVAPPEGGTTLPEQVPEETIEVAPPAQPPQDASAGEAGGTTSLNRILAAVLPDARAQEFTAFLSATFRPNDTEAGLFSRLFGVLQPRLFAAVTEPNALHDGTTPTIDSILRISLSTDGQNWTMFHTIDQIPISNALNGGYYLVDLPQAFAESLDTLQVRIEGARSGEKLEALVDSVFLSFSAGKIYEMDIVPTDLDGDERDAETDAEEAKHVFGLGQEASFHFKEKDLNRGLLEHFNRWAQDFPEPLVTINGELLDQDGHAVSGVEVGVLWQGRERFGNEVWDVTVEPPRELRPGKYSVAVTFTDEDGNTQTETQDFLWGVLALNVSKSIYFPDETVDFAFAVLDEKGAMVCDAEVTLQITHPNTNATLSTNNGTIVVNPECQVKAVTHRPDYEAHWKLNGLVQTGVYHLVLTAKTQNGTHTIEDNFEVRTSEQTLFDVHRNGPTRILPTEPYTMSFTVTANTDFEGKIVEPVPSSFVVVGQTEMVEVSGASIDTNDNIFGRVWHSIAENVKRLTFNVTRWVTTAFAQEEPVVEPPADEIVEGIPLEEAQLEETIGVEPPPAEGGPTSTDSPPVNFAKPSATELATSEIVWDNVTMTKGKTYVFRYAFDAPDISPEFWLTGPLRFVGTTQIDANQKANEREFVPEVEPAVEPGAGTVPAQQDGTLEVGPPEGGTTSPEPPAANAGENQNSAEAESGRLTDLPVRLAVNQVEFTKNQNPAQGGIVAGFPERVGTGIATSNNSIADRDILSRARWTQRELHPRLPGGNPGFPARWAQRLPIVRNFFQPANAQEEPQIDANQNPEAEPSVRDGAGTNTRESDIGVHLLSNSRLSAGTVVFEELRQWQIAADALPKGKYDAGDGLLVYGASANTTPQQRAYDNPTNAFGSASGTVAGTQANIVVLKASPTKDELVAGYIDASSNLQVMCYNGTTWTNEWSVAVGSATIRRFNIAYETNSGDALVLYSRNVATTNELGFRTKAGSTACGSANWSGENLLDATRTSGVVDWIELDRDSRSTSNRIAAAWGDANRDLTARIWTGAAWEAEPGAVLEANLDIVAAASDVDNIELETEATTGEAMVVWGRSVASNVNGAFYSTCTGADPCAWLAATAVPTVLDRVQWIEMDGDPLTDDLVYAAIGEAGASEDMTAAYWSGTAWTGFSNLDISAEDMAAGRSPVAAGFITGGSTTRCVIQYDDATGTGISWKHNVSPCTGAWTSPADQAVTPALNDLRDQYESTQNPKDGSELMVMISDSTGGIFAKRLKLASDGTTFTWSQPDGQVSLGTVNSAPKKDFAFTYFNFLPPVEYPKLTYEGYTLENDDEDQVISDPNVDENTQQAGTGVGTSFGLTADTGADKLDGVKKGERIVVRSHIKNTGTGATNGKNLALFYDRNDGIWSKVEAGKPATTAAGNCTDTNYDCTTVDDRTDILGYEISMAFDPSGNPWVSYRNFSPGALVVSNYVGSGGNCDALGTGSDAWNCTTVDDRTDAVGFNTSIAFDASGKPWVSYLHDSGTSDNLIVANYVGSGGNCDAVGTGSDAWNCTTVDDRATDAVGVYTSIAFDASGNAWVGHQNTTTSALVVSNYVGSGGNCDAVGTGSDAWNCTTVDDRTDTVGLYTSIAFDPSGNAWVSYLNNSVSALVVSNYVGSGGNCDAVGTGSDAWNCTTVDNRTDAVGSYTSIAFDPSGNPWVSHQNNSTGALVVSNYVGGTGGDCAVVGTGSNAWNCTTVDDRATDAVGSYTSIAFDASGKPWVSYQHDSGTSDNLIVANYVGLGGNCDAVGTGSDAWNCTTVDDRANTVGVYTSIAFDASGNAWVSHQNGTAGALIVTKLKRGGEIVISPSLAAGNSGVTIAESHADMANAGDTVQRDDTGTALCLAGTTVNWNNGKLFESEEGAVALAAQSGTTPQCTEVAFVIDTSQATAGTIYRLLLASKDNWRNDKGPWRGPISVAANCGSLSNEDCRPKLTIETPLSALRASKDNTPKFANCTDTGWGCVVVDDDANNQGQYTSIAVDHAGKAWVSYYDVTATALMVAEYVGTGGSGCGGAPAAWTCTTVDNTGTDKGQYTSIAIDPQGSPRVSYYDVTDSALMIAHYVGTGGTNCTSALWTCETVDNTGTNTGQYTSIAFDSAGVPWVNYYDVTNTALRVATRGGSFGSTCTDSDWTCGAVDADIDDTGSYSHIAFASGNVPWVSYYDATAFSLQVASYVGSGGTGCGVSGSAAWSCEVVDDVGATAGVGRYTSIAFAPDGNAWISYQDVDNADLKVANRVASAGSGCTGATNPTLWVCTTVDAATTLGLWTSLAFDASGNAWVAYFNDDATADNKALKVARYDGDATVSGCNVAAWTCTTVDSNGVDAVGEYASIAFDASGTPWVSYYDGVIELSLRVAKLHLPPTKPTPATTIAYPARSAIHGDARYRLDRGKAPATEGAGVCTATADREGYCAIGTDESAGQQYDSMVGGTGEWPMYVFAYTHTNATDTPQAIWHIRSTVAASVANPIRLQAYRFGTTKAWETVTSLTTGCDLADCENTNSVAGPVAEYFDTSPANTVYWRIYQENAATLKIEFVNLTPVTPGVNLSGTLYSDEGVTTIASCAACTVKVYNNISGTTATDSTGTDASGVWSVTGFATPANGNELTIFVDDGVGTNDATLVVEYGTACTGTPNCTDLNLYKNRVIVRGDDIDATLAVADMAPCDNDSGCGGTGDTDIAFTSNTGALTVLNTHELHVWTGDTFDASAVSTSVTTNPGGTGVGGDLHVVGTLNMGANALSIGASFITGASATLTLSAGQVTTMTATTSGEVLNFGPASTVLRNVTFNGVGGAWSNATNEMQAAEDFTITNGTFDSSGGSGTVEVNGHVQCGATCGVINLLGGQFSQAVFASKNFGTNVAVGTNWIFNTLIFGNKNADGVLDVTITTSSVGTGTIEARNPLQIARGGDTAGNQTTLDAGNRTWILSSTGTALTMNAQGILGENTSTFRYTGGGATNVVAETYYNLEVQPGANTITHTLGTAISQTITVAGNFIAGNGTNTGVVVTAATWDPILDINGNVTINATTTLVAPDLDTETGFTVAGNWTNSGTFTSGTVGRVTFDSTAAGKTLSGTLNGTSSFNQVTFNGTGGAWTITVPMLVTVGATEQSDIFIVRNGTVTIGDGTGDNLEVRGGVLIANTAGETGTLQTKQDLAEGTSLTIDIGTNTPALCEDAVPADVCIIRVGATTGAGTGTLDLGKNVTLRLNPFDDGGVGADSDTGIEVESTGYLEIQGTADQTGVDDTSGTGTSETKLCLSDAESYTASQHNNKVVRMTSGLAIGMIYSITATTVDDAACTPTTNDSITRADNTSADTAGGLTITGTGATRTVAGLAIATITANDQGIGRYLRDQTATTGYYKIVDSTDGGAGTDSVIIIAEPDPFANLLTTDTVDISDAVRSGDKYEILDYAIVQAESATCAAANTGNGEGYIYAKAGSQTLMRYSDICDLGRAVSTKQGIFFENIDGSLTNEGVTVEKSRVHDGYEGIFFSGVGAKNNRGGKGILDNDVYSTVSSGIDFDGARANDILRNVVRSTGGLKMDIRGGSHRNVLADNIVYGGTTTGINLDLADGNLIRNNTAFGSTAHGIIVIDGSDRNVVVSNTSFGNSGAGFSEFMGASETGNVFVNNKSYMNERGMMINGSGGTATDTLLINETYGTSGGNFSQDILVNDAAHTTRLYNTTLGSTTEVTSISIANAYVASFKHDATNGSTKIWNDYAISSNVTETPNNESLQQFNYANGLWPDSFTAHGYSGTGTEDAALDFAFSGAMGGAGSVYAYRIVCKNDATADCDSTVTTTNAWDVFRYNSAGTETDVGDVDLNELFTDNTVLDTTAVNTQFKICAGLSLTVDCLAGAGTAYATGDTYTFVAWKTSGDTNVQKTVDFQQDSDTLTVGTGTTLEVKGDTADCANAAKRTLVRHNAASGQGYQIIVNGTHDLQCSDLEEGGGASQTSGLDLNAGSTRAANSLNNTAWNNFGQAVTAIRAFIDVDASLIGAGADSQVITAPSFTNGNTNANCNFIESGTDAAGNWRIDSATGAFAGEANDCNDNPTAPQPDADPGRFKWVSGITVSGVIRQTNETTAFDCSVTNLTVRLRVNGAGTYSGTCTLATGAWSIANVTIGAAADVITVWLDTGAGTQKASAVTLAADTTSNITTMDLYLDRVIVRHENAGPITNTNLGQCDDDSPAACTDTDIGFTSNAGALTLASGRELHVWTGKTFDPGGTVTTNATGGDLHCDDTAVCEIDTATSTIGRDALVDAGANLRINASTNVNGGDITTAGTGTVTTTVGTPTVTISGTGSIGGGTGAITFSNLTTSGTGTTTAATAITVNLDLIVGTGTTLNGAQSVTVNGGDITGDGTISMTGGTVTLDGVGNFGGATGWTFSSLTIGGNAGVETTTSTGAGGITASGVLTIGANQTLGAGSKLWTLSGSGTPLVISGTFNADSSTFRYSATAATNITVTTYNNLELRPSGAGSPAYTTGTGTITTNAAFSVGDGTNAVTIAANTNNTSFTVNTNFTLNASTTWTKGTGTITFAGATTPVTWTDSNATKQDVGAVTAGSGPAKTVNMGSSVTATSVTVTGGATPATLSANGANTLTLTGAGTPLTLSGDNFTESTGTVVYNNDGAVTVTATTYNNLTLSPTITLARTYTMGGAMTVSGSLDINPTAATALNLLVNLGGATTVNSATTIRRTTSATSTLDTTSVNNYALTTSTLDIQAGGTLTANGSIITVTGSGTPFTLAGTFTSGTSTFRYTGTTATNITAATYNNLELIPAAIVTYTLGTALSQTITTNGYLTVGNGTNAVTVTGVTNDPVLDVLGNFTIAASGAFTASDLGTATFSVGGSWSNSATGTFTHSSQTVVFDDGAGDGQETIADGGDAFANIDFNGTGGDWLYTDGAVTAPTTTDVIAGTATFLNAKTGTRSVTVGTLIQDWYLSVHLVDQAVQTTNIDTTEDDAANGDVIVSEAGANSTVFRNGGPAWGSAEASKRTGTDAVGHIPQPNIGGAIRIREFSMTASATCPGAGCTLYRYNLEVENQLNWTYGEFDYFDDLGSEYIQSCLAGPSATCDDNGTTSDDVIGVVWYRSTIGTENAHQAINEPPTTGTWYVGLITGLSFTLSSTSITIPTLDSANSFTDATQTTTATVSTSASLGYRLTLWATQLLTRVGGSETIWMFDDGGVVPNSAPTDWAPADTCQSGANQCGFGYSTNDATLASPGTADRFTGAGCGADAKCWAGFPTSGSGDLVGDSTSRVSGATTTMSYKLSVDVTRAAGSYTSTLIYVLTAQY